MKSPNHWIYRISHIKRACLLYYKGSIRTNIQSSFLHDPRLSLSTSLPSLSPLPFSIPAHFPPVLFLLLPPSLSASQSLLFHLIPYPFFPLPFHPSFLYIPLPLFHPSLFSLSLLSAPSPAISFSIVFLLSPFFSCCFLPLPFLESVDENKYAQGDSDVISFHIYVSWFSPPFCG